jgi:hypothetical protein
MATLTDRELRALRNLGGRGEGAIADFLNIADARRLTELGLAQRTQQGWEITPEGAAQLAQDERPQADGSSVVDFKKD